jgi:hypothetical protein
MSGGALERVKAYPLSDGDIRRVLGDDIKVFTYPQLKRLRSADDLFDSKGRCIILFLTESETAGHWCCLLNKKKGIEFFDPYGDDPDGVKDEIPKSKRDELDMNQPYLMRLLAQSGRPVTYNSYPFQREKQDVNTCGRHCVARLLYAPYSLDKYGAIIKKSKMNPDDFVSGLTYDKIRK